MPSRRHKCSRNTGKSIPQDLLGIAVLSPYSDTMQGVYDWLKNERLHKYWPMFSRMAYSTIVGLSEDNFDDVLAEMGAGPITYGARRRILRCTKRLRERVVELSKLDELTPLEDVADVFHRIVTSPLSSTDFEPNGHSLLLTLLSKFNFLFEVHGCSLFTHAKLIKALQCLILRPEVSDHDKKYVEDRLKTCDKVMKTAELPAPSSKTPSSNVKADTTSSAAEVRKFRSGTPNQQTSYRKYAQPRRPSSLPPADRASASLLRKKFRKTSPQLPQTLSLSEPSKLNKTPLDYYVGQPLFIQSTELRLTDISFLPVFSAFIPFQVAQFPSSPSTSSSVSFLSDTSSDERSCCAVECSWLENQHLWTRTLTLKLSYYWKLMPTVDVDRTWGGVKNQVMIDLAASSA